MPPKLKKVASDSQKKPRAKTKSDKIYNARRRAKRALAKLQQNIDFVKTELGQKTISQYQKLISQSYAETKGKKRGQYIVQPEQLERRLTSASEAFKERGAVYRKNTMFKRELNLARKGDETSKFTSAEVNIFYTFTKQYWEGRPPSKRNEAILEGLSVKTLEEAWEIVFSNENVKDALKRAKQNQMQAETDEDISDGEFEPPDEAGSPPYIEFLINKISTR